MKYKYLILGMLLLYVFGCKNQKTNEVNKVVNIDNIATNNKYTLIPMKNSTMFPQAGILSYKYDNGEFHFDLIKSNYELGVQTNDTNSTMCANSSKGQHIHLIVDNLPYAAKYTSSFAYDIKDGEHYILAFLSRSYHESIKTKKAHVANKVTVRDKKIVERQDVEDMMIFYSRPKGTYIGKDTKNVMLDFYLHNTDLKDGNYVIVDINGEKHTVETWQPYIINGLTLGENSISLLLVNSDGQKIDSPLNPVKRTFILREEELSE